MSSVLETRGDMRVAVVTAQIVRPLFVDPAACSDSFVPFAHIFRCYLALQVAGRGPKSEVVAADCVRPGKVKDNAENNSEKKRVHNGKNDDENNNDNENVIDES